MSRATPPRPDLDGLVAHAVRAPSVLNTQPWRFVVDGADGGGAVRLYADRARQLPALDPGGRELTVSCGAALLYLRLAARHEGWEAEVEAFPDAADPDLLAAVAFRPGHRPGGDDRLFRALATRRTNRRPFADEPVPFGVAAEVAGAASAEGASLRVLDGQDEKDALARLVSQGVLAQGEDRAVTADLQAWLRPTGDPRPDGVWDSAQGMWDRHSSLRTPVADVAEYKSRLVQRAPAVLVLSTFSDGPADWLRAGQALARALVVAADRGSRRATRTSPSRSTGSGPRWPRSSAEATPRSCSASATRSPSRPRRGGRPAMWSSAPDRPAPAGGAGPGRVGGGSGWALPVRSESSTHEGGARAATQRAGRRTLPAPRAPPMRQQHAEDLSAVRPETTGHVPGPRKFGTFAGVFTPTLLTILGVIMYLRTGWMVGNAGVLGTLGVVGLSFGITLATGLAMSSITTNIRIGAGGAYSIISQSLGLEVGGSVGIPLYLSQALAVALYVFGFREGWAWVFPEHPAILVDLGVFAVILGVAYVSASFAFRVQYLIMAVIAGSLVSVAVAAAQGSMTHRLVDIGLVGPYAGSPEDGFSGTSFWAVFAVFFPAATGIMAGANMSGDLRDPKRSIPVGTLSAIAVSLVIYVLLAYWLARSATTGELVSNYTVMIDRASWGPAVVAGLLGATFSSALASIVGAPRILQALGDHGVLPRGAWLAERTPKGEPRHALLVTAAIVAGALLLRDLNAIAPVITMFFLITYAMINFVVFVEGQLGLVSFRPTLRVPQFVPLAGLVGCLLAMFVVNPTFALAAVVVVVAFYGFLLRRQLEAPYGDVRSGLFVALAEWAAKRVGDMPTDQERAWKPNLLVPVEDVAVLRGTFEVVLDVARPRGSVKLVGINGPLPPAEGGAGRLDRLPTLAAAFRRKGVFSSFAVVDAGRFEDGVVSAVQALRGSFFRPNILFLPLPAPDGDAAGGAAAGGANGRGEAAFARAVGEARRHQLGTLVWAPHPTAGLGQRHAINVWVHDRTPDWGLSMDIGNLDLSLLVAYKLKRNWDGAIRLITVVADEGEVDRARHFLTRLIDVARLPSAAPIAVAADFNDYVTEAPQADLNLFGLGPDPTFASMHGLVRRTRASALFVRDSGLENALA